MGRVWRGGRERAGAMVAMFSGAVDCGDCEAKFGDVGGAEGNSFEGAAFQETVEVVEMNGVPYNLKAWTRLI